MPQLPAGLPGEHFPDLLILPGFIDTHIHYPQTQVIASYGAQLLEWLEKYTFVEEQKFADPAHAAPRSPTSSSTSWRATAPRPRSPIASVHPDSADAFFRPQRERRNMPA